MGIGAPGQDFLKITCRGFHYLVLGIWKIGLDLFLLGSSESCSDGYASLVQIASVFKFGRVFSQD